ncbi:MAG: ArsC/Spx/MgsR family protein [Methylovulum sp.]|nr:ArsC/Spx/MgsR family protein [Methylovulum sp.]
MATVIFYEKPGCRNNTRQKQMLAAAGHQVFARNLLTEVWQAEQLRAFFGLLPVSNWFNYQAPAITIGQVTPDTLNEQQALALMLDNPLLIRRPLMQVGETRRVGFDLEQIDAWLGLAEADTSQDVQTCHKSAGLSACRHD